LKKQPTDSDLDSNKIDFSLKKIADFSVSSANIFGKKLTHLFIMSDHINEIDISDPSNPQIVGESNVLENNRCYGASAVNGYNIFVSLSCTNPPDSIFSLQSYQPYERAGQIGNIPEGGYDMVLSDSGTRLYVVSGNGFFDNPPKVSIVNVSSPSQLNLVREISGLPHDGFCGKLYKQDNILFANCWDDGVYQVNLLTGDNFKKFIPSLDESVDIAIFDTTAFVANRTEGVQIVSLNNPTQTINQIWANRNSTEYVNIFDNFLYVINGSLLDVYSITNPATPEQVFESELPGTGRNPLKIGNDIVVPVSSNNSYKIVVFEKQ